MVRCSACRRAQYAAARRFDLRLVFEECRAPAHQRGAVAAGPAEQALATGRVKALAGARKRFLKEHGRVFKVLRMMQDTWYRDDDRRERFVSICHDIDVQRLTFEAYMNKKLVMARPMAHVRIMAKNIGHLLRLIPAVQTGPSGLASTN